MKKEETEQHLVTWFKTYDNKKKLHYYNLDGIIQFLVRKKLEIKKKNI